MPVDFLTEAQKRRYGRYPEDLGAVQLARYFHVDDTDRQLIAQRRGDANRLGFALQLLTVRFLGTFLPNPTEVPAVVVAHVARQLALADVSCLPRYLDPEPTRHEHRTEIRAVYGYRDLGPPWSFRLARWLYLRAWLGNERPSLLFDQATAWAPTIARMPRQRRIATLVAFVAIQEINALDMRRLPASRSWLPLHFCARSRASAGPT